MTEKGWRTIIADSGSELSCSDGNLQIKVKENVYTFALYQLSTVLIATTNSTVTSEALNELCKNNVRVIFCDEKYNPTSELCVYRGHSDVAGRIMDQAAWKSERKSEIWKLIVEQKIKNQSGLLEYLKILYPDILIKYLNTVTIGDSDNREGQAARVYFSCLFGTKFIRHHNDSINAALNYGYTILLSIVNRTIALYGYNNCIGIKHCNRSNPFNLACDIMEPFRPYIDLVVFRNVTQELDWEYKQKLIAINYMPVIYENSKMELSTAIEKYTLSVLHGAEGKEFDKKEMYYIE